MLKALGVEQMRQVAEWPGGWIEEAYGCFRRIEQR